MIQHVNSSSPMEVVGAYSRCVAIRLPADEYPIKNCVETDCIAYASRGFRIGSCQGKLTVL